MIRQWQFHQPYQPRPAIPEALPERRRGQAVVEGMFAPQQSVEVVDTDELRRLHAAG